MPNVFSSGATCEGLTEEEATEEYEAVVTPIYEELLVGCLANIMSDASQGDLARTYGELMVSLYPQGSHPLTALLILWNIFVTDTGFPRDVS